MLPGVQSALEEIIVAAATIREGEAVDDDLAVAVAVLREAVDLAAERHAVVGVVRAVVPDGMIATSLPAPFVRPA